MAHLHGYCVFLGKTADCSETSVALQEAKELVKAFGTRSSRAPRVLSMMDSLFNKLQPQVRSTFEICDRKNCWIFSQHPNVSVWVERPSWFWCRHERWQRWRQSACDCSSLSPGSVGPVWENLVQRDWSKVSGTGWSLGCCFRDYEFRISFFLKRGVGGMYNLITVSMRSRGLCYMYNI